MKDILEHIEKVKEQMFRDNIKANTIIIDSEVARMSYIRTKDGRILDFDKLNEVSKLSIDMAEEPIREADTIEELCDEFVIHRIENDYTFVWNKERNVGFYYFCSFPEKYDVYGAIYTDKGLIYVAKMDEKGELELI